MPFVKAVRAGTAVGMALPFIICVWLGIEYRGFWVLGTFLVLLVNVLLVVLLGSLFVGIPTAMLLRSLRWESFRAYTLLGAGTGFLFPLGTLFMLSAPAGYWLSFLGMLSGAATGATWWRQTRSARSSIVRTPLALQA